MRDIHILAIEGFKPVAVRPVLTSSTLELHTTGDLPSHPAAKEWAFDVLSSIPNAENMPIYLHYPDGATCQLT